MSSNAALIDVHTNSVSVSLISNRTRAGVRSDIVGASFYHVSASIGPDFTLIDVDADSSRVSFVSY